MHSKLNSTYSMIRNVQAALGSNRSGNRQVWDDTLSELDKKQADGARHLFGGEDSIGQLVEGVHGDVLGPGIIQVTPAVNAQVRADGDPHVLVPPHPPILHYQPCTILSSVTTI